MSVIVLASFTAQVNEAEGAFGVFGSGTVEQTVAGSPLEDFDAVTTIVATGTGEGPGGGGTTPTDGGTSLATAAANRIRWTGSRILWIEDNLPPGATVGDIVLEEDLTPGRQTTLRFQTAGQLWAMPTPEDFDDSQPDPGDPAPPAPQVPSEDDPDTSPRAWGNKPVEAFMSFGQSPRTMVEAKVFKGLSLQKSNHGDTAILGEITCVDDSIRYADVPLCYELQPFSGKRRGEITKEMAISVGVPADKIIVPIGNLVTKPILLSNGSLLTFLNEFWKGENGWAHFDEDGNLVVELVNLKETADWTLDAELGDYDLDSFEEVPPTRPPSRYYVKATTPVEVGDGTGTGGPGDGTTTQTDEQTGPYNPKCVKVRPSGLTSYLQADGSYRVSASDSIMVVGRTVTETTTVGGRQTQKIVRKYGWYNPTAYDPNFNTAPPGTSYDGAYGDMTFHRDEAEAFMPVSTMTTAYQYDANGTLLRQVETLEGWYAPHRAGNYASDRITLTNGNGGYVFPCSTTRIQPIETYQVTDRVEKSYIFDSTGTLTRVSEKTFQWYSASAACDLYTDDATHLATPPPTSPNQSPCPGGYGGSGSDPSGGGVTTEPPPFRVLVTGPTYAGGLYLTFHCSALGLPASAGGIQNWMLDTSIVEPCSVNPITVAGSSGQLEFDFTIRQCVYQPASTQASVVVSISTNLTSDVYTSEPLFFTAIS